MGDHERAVTAEIEADVLRMAQAVGPDLAQGWRLTDEDFGAGRQLNL
jgi:hypothetical protein